METIKIVVLALFLFLGGTLFGTGATYLEFINKRLDGDPYCRPYDECVVVLEYDEFISRLSPECDLDMPKGEYLPLVKADICEKRRNPEDGFYLSSTIIKQNKKTYIRKTYACPASGSFVPKCTIDSCRVFSYERGL